MKGFVINLDKDISRMNSIKEKFKNIGSIQLERYPGILGADIADDDQVSDMCKMFCTNGMIGCFASHLAVMKKIVDENIDKAVILEDDAVPVNDFDDKWNELQDKIPPDFDILLLGHVGQTSKIGPLSLLPYLFNIRKETGKKINSNIDIPYMPLGTHAYVISNKCAKHVLANYNQIKYHIDFYLFSRKDLKIYSVNPFLIITGADEGASLGITHIDLPFIKNIKLNSGQNLSWYIHNCLFRVKNYNVLVWHIILLSIITIILSIYLNSFYPVIFFYYILFMTILIIKSMNY